MNKSNPCWSKSSVLNSSIRRGRRNERNCRELGVLFARSGRSFSANWMFSPVSIMAILPVSVPFKWICSTSCRNIQISVLCKTIFVCKRRISYFPSKVSHSLLSCFEMNLFGLQNEYLFLLSIGQRLRISLHFRSDSQRCRREKLSLLFGLFHKTDRLCHGPIRIRTRVLARRQRWTDPVEMDRTWSVDRTTSSLNEVNWHEPFFFFFFF